MNRTIIHLIGKFSFAIIPKPEQLILSSITLVVSMRMIGYHSNVWLNAAYSLFIIYPDVSNTPVRDGNSYDSIQLMQLSVGIMQII